MNTAPITDIKRFAVHDGDGIRTTVFFKGCPLQCLWCHNPESIKKEREIAFFAHKCTSCGACADLCSAHTIAKEHHFDRTKCTQCTRCTEICPSGALVSYGKEMTVDEVFETVLQDRIFYESSGGGVTLSGGECLLYPDFCRALLAKCKEAGISCAIDTCGAVKWEAFRTVIPFTDLFLYDIKALDEKVHLACTGASNRLILENLLRLDEMWCKTEIRIPYVPSCNDKELPAIADFIRKLHHVIRVRILPYHNFATSKYFALGHPSTLPNVLLPTKEQCRALEEQYFA